MFELALGELDELLVAHGPKPVTLCAKIFEAKASLCGVRYHVRAPVLKILDPTDLHFRIVDVDPVIREKVRLVYDTNDGKKIPVSEPFGGIDNVSRRRFQTTDEFGHRHARDEAGSPNNLFASIVPDNDIINVSSGPVDPDHL
jgi:hypothetical protein